ncbi:MAG: VOC family protein [Thermomicrobiales bacterium]|nr:VOC family protein [Thermomicrobiales bacterium]
MPTNVSHLQYFTKGDNLGFYRDLMGFLGWETLHDDADQGIIGFGSPDGVSIWFVGHANDAANDYDGVGLNHLALGAASIAEVDATVDYLARSGVPALFETPRHRPEFAWGEGQTYYQVMFETPDRLLLEIVYTGPYDGPA